MTATPQKGSFLKTVLGILGAIAIFLAVKFGVMHLMSGNIQNQLLKDIQTNKR